MTGPISETNTGSRAEDLAAALDEALADLARLDVLDDPGRRAVARGASAGSRPSARTRGRSVRTRSTGVISSSIVRIGLIFSALPSQRLRGADAAAAAQELERVDGEPDLQSLARARASRARRPARRSPPPRAAAAAASTMRPMPAAGAARVDDLDRAAARRARRARPRPGARTRGAGDAAGEVDRDDVVAGLEQRLVDREEVADRRLRGRRQRRCRAQALVERVEVAACRTRARACRRQLT